MKYLKESTLMIIDVVKETIILCIALIIIINYFINKDTKFESCELINNSNVNHTSDFRDPWECIKLIMNINLESVIRVLKNCTNIIVSFVIFVGLLYIFFYFIKIPKQFDNNKSFDENVKFILQDFGNKLTFILLFPTLFISIISLVYISIKIMFELPTKAPEFGFIMSYFTKIMMAFLFLILFTGIGKFLYYLLTTGNDINFFDILIYSICFFLISLLIFAGFHKLLLFNLNSTFVPNIKDIINKLNNKDMRPIYFIIVNIICFTFLINIKQLLTFEEWIFASIMYFIIIILLSMKFQNIYFN